MAIILWFLSFSHDSICYFRYSGCIAKFDCKAVFGRTLHLKWNFHANELFCTDEGGYPLRRICIPLPHLGKDHVVPTLGAKVMYSCQLSISNMTSSKRSSAISKRSLPSMKRSRQKATSRLRRRPLRILFCVPPMDSRNRARELGHLEVADMQRRTVKRGQVTSRGARLRRKTPPPGQVF